MLETKTHDRSIDAVGIPRKDCVRTRIEQYPVPVAPSHLTVHGIPMSLPKRISRGEDVGITASVLIIVVVRRLPEEETIYLLLVLRPWQFACCRSFILDNHRAAAGAGAVICIQSSRGFCCHDGSGICLVVRRCL